MAPEPDKTTPAPPAPSAPVTPPATPAPPVAQAPPIEDDPLVVEYAETLKASLGKFYEKDYDKLPLKERIATMKTIKKTLDKMPTRGEGNTPNAPEPEGVVTKAKDHVDRWKAGERGFHQSTVFAVHENKS